MKRALTRGSLGHIYQALVIGASGALGTEFCKLSSPETGVNLFQD